MTSLHLAVALLVCSALDGVSTLALVSRGAAELNPFLAAVLAHDPTAFVLTKLALVTTAVLVLVLLERRWVLWVGNALYAAVLIAHAYVWNQVL